MNYAASAPRARNTDPSTSHDAARFALSGKAESERRAIYRALVEGGPMTPREIASATGIDYYEVQRRMSETEGIEPTVAKHDRCRIWKAA